MRSIKQLKKNTTQPNRPSIVAPIRIMRGRQSLLTQSLLIFCSFLFIAITSCAPSSTDTTSTPTDNSTLFASLIKTSNPNISGLTVTADNSNPANPKVTLGNLTNGASEVFTASINIDQDKGITTDPASFTITASEIISPDTITTELMVTFGSEPPVSYTITTLIGGAPVNDWIVNDKLGDYISVSFANQTHSLSITDATLSITGLTNIPTGTGEITFTLPTGFTSDPERIEIPNPDGTKATMSIPNPKSFTITETGNTENSRTYEVADIALAELTRFTPGIHIQITESGSTTPISGLTITEEAGNMIRIVGLTNKTDQTIRTPNTYTLTINEVSGYFTLPPGNNPLTRTITEPAEDFSPGAGTITSPNFEITHNGESTPTMYTLEVVFSGAAVNDWFPGDNLMSRITASFSGQNADTLTLSEGTIAISHSDSANNFTNVPNGAIDLTPTFPTGYTLTGTGALIDPDGMGLAAVDAGFVGMITIVETGNTANSATYSITITLAAYKSPLTAANITAMYGGVTATPSDITIDTNMITISGFTNKNTNPAESGIVTFPTLTGYTITPSPLTIPDPDGQSATTANLEITVTDTRPGGVAVPHPVTINFLGLTELSVTSADINGGNPMSLGSGTTIPITTAACELLATPTVTVVGVSGSKVADITPFPVYYDRERDPPIMTSGTLTGYTVTRRLNLEDGNSNMISTGFAVTMVFPACTTFAGSGDGTSGAPYVIDNAPRLELASYLVNTEASYRSSHYKITNNINMGLSGFPLSEAGSGTAGKGFLPIGRESTKFSGTLDCDSKTISGLYINRPDSSYVGLLGFISNANIKNCSLTSVNITGDDMVGGLVGGNFTNSTVSNSHTTGSVSAMNNEVGGLVGFNFSNSTISDSYSEATVSGTRYYVGGLVGANSHTSTISNSYAIGTVSGNYHVGGLVGNNQTNSMIIDSYATGPVTGMNINVGGLVAFNFENSVISNSYATGNVMGSESNVGGLVGSDSNAMIIASYATGTVSGDSFSVGGLVGTTISSTITDSYATGNVTGFNFVGGLVGWNVHPTSMSGSSSMVTNSYATGNVTASTSNSGLFIGFNGKFETDFVPVSTGVTDSYYNNGSTLTVRSSVVTEKGVGSDTSSVTTTGLTGLSTANLQVAKGTMTGETYFTWNSSIWRFTAGKYPQLIDVVCANRQDNPAADCM
ncbi:hypothetical protein COTS27_00853 [Spirochaetota bacterium]|nr:hypothetical protein COTS27_00853 [Spirochaetota bacterium]